jgi:hypothetical protein
MENCLIQDFKCGIVVEKGAKLNLMNSQITFKKTSIVDCVKHAIVQYS